MVGRGIVLELQHTLLGLQQGTILIAKSSNLKWKISARILFNHAVHQQKHFKCESVEYSLFSFSSLEKRNKSIQAIVNKENQGIFQYMIESIEHGNKPEDGEVLIISDESLMMEKSYEQ